jgi:endonuclease YncB( thermonuclease family)
MKGFSSIFALVSAVTLALGLLALPVDLAASAESLDGPFQARVVEVIDGDSLRVVVRVWLGQHIVTLVRIRGIDAPEHRGACAGESRAAQAATEALGRLVAPGTVVLSDIAGDKYFGRVLADVTLESGASLREEMLHSGLARVYDGGTRASWCSGERPKPWESVVEIVR